MWRGGGGGAHQWESGITGAEDASMFQQQGGLHFTRFG